MNRQMAKWVLVLTASTIWVACGGGGSASTRVVITPPPPPTDPLPQIDSFVASQSSINSGEPINLIATFSGGIGQISCTTNESLSNAQPFVNVFSGIPRRANPDVPTTYSLTVDDGKGHQISKNVFVNVTAPMSAELFDPVSGQSVATGNMATYRRQHTTTKLQNGQVLVVGGWTRNWGSTSYCEIYDPVTGNWKETGQPSTPKLRHVAILLTSGKVLVAGGYEMDGGGSVAELFDPVMGTWSQAKPLNQNRELPGIVQLLDGRVLLCGGDSYSNPETWLHSVEIFNPTTNMWALTGPMNDGRVGHTATVIANGKVLVAGGHGVASFDSAELYDPTTEVWTRTGSMHRSRSFHSATLLADGRVLVSGGYDLTDGASNGGGAPEAEIYDPTSGMWTQVGSLAIGRHSQSGNLLPSGNVTVIGGMNWINYQDSVETFSPVTNQWTTTGRLLQPRFTHSSVMLPNGMILVVGGNQINPAP